MLNIPLEAWTTLGAILGAMTGSFLNVCIYRLPRELSVRKPARSFCPACSQPIPWYRNIPLLSWLLLRGRGACCKQPISPRYLLVEALTAILFALIAWKTGPSRPGETLALWILTSLLVVGTFVDLEHLIIPDEVTMGGAIAGILCSTLWPALHLKESFWMGSLLSLIGAASGYGLLWAVVELGRLAFGRRRIRFDRPAELCWIRNKDTARLLLEGEETEWAELFVRGTERLRMRVQSALVDGQPAEEGEWIWEFEKLHIGKRSLDLNTLERIDLTVSEIIIPREVMGFGDVKFLGAIGAFLGWEAVLFTLTAASLGGVLLGTTATFLGRREFSSKIPFGPYLAAGAFLWVMAGPALLNGYWNLLNGIHPGR